jgi:RimJ/RimL family protein N-acetyltransferase
MEIILTSERLSLELLQPADADFIFELVNTPEWIRFIGDRNVTSREKAETFVHSVIKNTNVNYWVVRLKEGSVPVGIVSLVKRDYLDSHDVGFAFLPEHTRRGFAYEASQSLLRQLAEENLSPIILATTVKENASSIALLEKLGFHFDKQIDNGGEELLVYAAPLSDFR